MGRKKINIDVKRIPLDMINEPKLLVRSDLGTRDELLELGASMKGVGQIQPIVVTKSGDRFDLIVGQRRVHAAKMVGMLDIEAKIIKAGVAEQALIRYKENDERLANSPYEEALFVKEMLDNIGCSQVELSKLMNKSAAYVTQRLAILDGYASVREALKNREINFAQGRELLLMPDEQLANQYTEVVKEGGATSDLIRRWRNELQVAYKQIERERPTDEEREIQRTAAQMMFRKCEICNTVTDPIDLTYIKACRVCAKTLTKELSKYRGEA